MNGAFPTPKGVSRPRGRKSGIGWIKALVVVVSLMKCSLCTGTSILLYPGTWLALSNGSCPYTQLY